MIPHLRMAIISISGSGIIFGTTYRWAKKGIVPHSFSFVVNDEVHINFGKEIVNNYFDQNRFFVGLKYQLNERLICSLGI